MGYPLLDTPLAKLSHFSDLGSVSSEEEGKV